MIQQTWGLGGIGIVGLCGLYLGALTVIAGGLIRRIYLSFIIYLDFSLFQPKYPLKMKQMYYYYVHKYKMNLDNDITWL